MQKVKILVVEDEVALVKSFRLALEAEGFDVSTAGSGLECLRQVRREPPDILVLDVMLPELDGFKVCRLLKFNRATSRIPIILCTARGSEADRRRGRAAGADAYLVKPFEMKELLEMVHGLISRPVLAGA